MPVARAVPIGLIAGLAASLLALMAGLQSPGAVILVGMSSLPLFLAGLGAGGLAFAVAVIAGISAASLVGGVGFGGVFVEVAAFPALVLVPLALARPVPPSARRLVLGLTALGCAAFLVLYLVALDQDGGLEGIMRVQTADMLWKMQQQSDSALPAEIEPLEGAIAFWSMGLGAAMWLLIAAGNAALAQGVLVRFGHNLRPTPPMASLDLPWPISVAFAACLAAWLFGSGPVAYVGGNLAEILAVPLTLGGLAVIHMAVRRYPARLLILIGVYVALVFVWPIALIVAIGIVEQWVGLRRRLADSPDRGET